ncbi:helix-turn-helix domain-containing protein [Actinoplanes sp. NPDC051851]|uniref:nSTAND1 domain-containing NTPase n=1 Tax=Actinoplanes sp. NPDC051851 TaxID=3154753 RepID=UPI00341EBEAD
MSPPRSRGSPWRTALGGRTIRESAGNGPEHGGPEGAETRDVFAGDIETRDELGDALSTLRRRAGLSIRELAARSGLPPATVGGYVKATHLPGPAQRPQFRALLTACGVTTSDLAAWEDALGRVRARTDGRQVRRGADGPPYRGLRPFEAEDAGLFFGRSAFVDEVLDRLAALRESGPDLRLLFLVGASGSGKSSLLRAGVVPAVTADGGSVAAMTPGADPVKALREALSGTAEPRVLVVDQFEEVYTVAGEHGVDFVGELAGLGPGTLVVAGIRADFFAAAAADPVLVPALQEWQMVVPPLTEEQLRAAIVGPAEACRVPVDEALVEVALADVLPARRGGSGYPGHQNVLPLLSHVLLAAWETRERGRLTLAHYRAAGGLSGAVQQSAEQAYAELSEAERELARRLFLRLVTVDEETVATKRPVGPAELPAGREVMAPVIERFVARRLITVHERYLEISHDALLTAWPRLAEWITADHAGLLVHRRLARAADDWRSGGIAADGTRSGGIAADGARAGGTAAGSDDPGLMRGNLLAQVTEWARDPDHRALMNGVERELLDRSLAAVEAERESDRKRVRVLRQLVGALLVVVLVAVGLAGYAFRAGAVAADQREAAGRARDEALSRQVAIESARARDVDPALAEQLALAAYRISPTLDARSALLDATGSGVVHRLVGTSGPTVLRIDPSGTLMAVSSAADGTVGLYRYAGGRPVERLGVVPAGESGTAGETGSTGNVVYAIAFSPEGRTLAVGGEDGRVRLYDVREPRRPVALGVAPGNFAAAVESLAFDPSGTRLVAGGGSPSLRAWGIMPGADWSRPAPLWVTGGREVIQSVAYSPDGHSLAAAGSSGTVQVWPAGRLESTPASIVVGAGTITAIAWSPGGETLVAGAKDGTAVLLDVAGHRVRRRLETGFTSWVNAAAYSPDGGRVAVGGSNNTLVVFGAETGERLDTVASAAQITAVAYSPDGTVLHVGAADGVVRSVPVPRRVIDAASGALFALGVDRGGTRLAVASTGARGHVQLWSLKRGAAAGSPAGTGNPAGDGAVAGGGAAASGGDVAGAGVGAGAGVTPGGRLELDANAGDFGASAGSVAISPDGRSVVTGNRAGSVLMTTGSTHATLSGSAALIEALQFSADGRLVAAAADDDRVHLWDVHDPAAPRRLPDLDTGGQATNVAFSPDGRYLAATSADRSVHLWDISDPAAARELPSLGGFGNYAWSVAFSPDSRVLAAGGADDTVRLWDISDPERPRALGEPLTGPTHYVYSLAFRPDGSELAASGGDGSVWTWRVDGLSATAAPHASPTATLHAANPGGKTYAIAYLPGGTALAAVGTAGTVTFWDTDERRVIDALCAGGGDGLTAAEWEQYVPGAAYVRSCP